MPHYDIAILLPTRGRAEQLTRSVQSLLDLASKNTKIEILFGVDKDDSSNTEQFLKVLNPYLDQNKIDSKILVFEPLGYANLHHYVNTLAQYSSSQWLFFWNDDALMQTPNWDEVICSYTGQFKLLSVHTHNSHPYSIFPIIPKEWYNCLNHISLHSLNDAWVSTIAYMLDIFERIPVYVEHDRHDLTGNNEDATYQQRVLLEGNQNHPLDFNHIEQQQKRLHDAATLATWMQDQNMDLSFFTACCEGRQDPWEKLRLNDPNNQISSEPTELELNKI